MKKRGSKIFLFGTPTYLVVFFRIPDDKRTKEHFDLSLVYVIDGHVADLIYEYLYTLVS